MKVRPALHAFASVAACIHLANCTLAARSNPLAREGGVTGTYAVTMCRGACGGGAVLTTGTLVIEDQSYSLADIPEPARGYFGKTARILMREDAGNAPNVCFVLNKSGRETLAGSTPVGMTRWTLVEGDTVALRLYHSADAGYDARVAIRSGRLSGIGESWGPWPESENSPPDGVIGRRLGPPDRGICIRAAEERLKHPVR